jgi:hypothetical protein
VLDAIARTLQLDDTEHEHLLDLFRAARRTSRPRAARRAQPRVRATLQRVLDSLDAPAFVENARLDILATNHLGRALYAASGQELPLPFNAARFLFLDPRARDFHLDWGHMARNQVALLRTESGRDPDNADLITLIGQLSTHSEEFRQLWANHDVRRYREGPKRFKHPIAGELEFIGESFEVSKEPGLVLLTYTITPGSPTQQGMALLGSWAASPPEPRVSGRSVRDDIQTGIRTTAVEDL